MNRPTIVCLCGSTRFKDAFVEANLRETLAGRIVLSIGCDQRTDSDLFEELATGNVRLMKARLDVLHMAKIDLADEVMILNRDGYIGESTEREIEYARMRGKVIRWLEPVE
jgi:hypothetical protein